MKQNNLMQRENGTWAVEVSDGTIITTVAELGLLDKDQAIREALRKGYDPITVWDKEVLAAIRSGAASPPANLHTELYRQR